MNLALPSFGCREYAKWLLSPSVVTPWCEHCGHRRWSQEQGYVFLTYLCAVVEVGEWTCSSVVELAKSLFVCYAASNDITWFTTKAGVKGVSSGFLWPCLWNMSSRKRQKDSLRPKRNLPLINSSAFTPNDHRPAAVCAAFLTLKWRFGLFVTFLLRGGSGLASKYMHKCHVLWFFEAKSSVFQHYRSVSWKLFRCVRCPIQLQELLTQRVS